MSRPRHTFDTLSPPATRATIRPASASEYRTYGRAPPSRSGGGGPRRAGGVVEGAAFSATSASTSTAPSGAPSLTPPAAFAGSPPDPSAMSPPPLAQDRPRTAPRLPRAKTTGQGDRPPQSGWRRGAQPRTVSRALNIAQLARKRKNKKRTNITPQPHPYRPRCTRIGGGGPPAAERVVEG